MACVVASAKYLSAGGDQDWSAAVGRLVFDEPDSAGIYQLYTMKPDGSARTCLSCTAAPGAPPVDRHKFDPVWDPSGQYIVAQGEMAKNPIDWLSGNKYVSELQLNGIWNDLYALTPDGSRWYKLTDTGSPQTDGVMMPFFSADGKKLLWSRIVAPASKQAPWGVWRLMVADFVVTTGGPTLQNVTDITPPDGQFFEAHGFSPDGRTVIFTANIGVSNQWQQNIWAMDLASRKLTNLTHNTAWNEHATYAPSGKTIVYMSTQPYPGTALKADLMMMNADGSNTWQLTHFNVPGSLEYNAQQSMPIRSTWSADGTQLAVTLQMAKTYPARQLWMLTFAGRCGG
jgi:Tol biopolymer transport system component